MLPALVDDIDDDGMVRFNGHPPLGVNATAEGQAAVLAVLVFQWAPTLGGECYR